MTESFDAIVIGAGAAGLMCAIEASRRGRRVAMLEHTDRIGKKILVSGGGRCNFTNIHARPENFICANPHFHKSALARYTPADFIRLIEKHRIRYHEKTLGQLFCDGSANEIVKMLHEELFSTGGKIFLSQHIHEISRPDEFAIRAGQRTFRAPALVIATGGLSVPKMGATGLGYEIAKQFGHKIIECRPALVSLVFAEKERRQYCELSGCSFEVIATNQRQSFREKLLITHLGISGPAVLQISSYWRPGELISLDLLPDTNATAAILKSSAGRNRQALLNALRTGLPNRFVDRWLDFHLPAKWTNAALTEFEQTLHNWEVAPAGTDGYDKAEVTSGGVDTAQLSAKTMESRLVNGLYFVGEVVDVTGQLGGFNFQWAWASGFNAGQAV